MKVILFLALILRQFIKLTTTLGNKIDSEKYKGVFMIEVNLGTKIEQQFKFTNNNEKCQASGERGTHSPPATPNHLQNPKWPPGGPELADGVLKGVYF